MKTVLILSGGMDSAVLLHHLQATGHEVAALSIDYGQRHRRELHCAGYLAREAHARYQLADLSSLRPLLAGSSQTDGSVEVPHGHYSEESMKQTVVPNRNMLLLSCAIAWAVSLKFDAVAYGAHAGDHAIYPDCREEFCKAMAEVAKVCDWHPVELVRPFIAMTKGEIVKRGLELGVPFQHTWTCYEGLHTPCGKCGSCVERAEAFAFAGAPDPLLA